MPETKLDRLETKRTKMMIKLRKLDARVVRNGGISELGPGEIDATK